MVAVVVIAAIVFFIAVVAFVMRGSLGLVKNRLEEQPELAPDRDDDDGLPTDVEY